MDLLPICYLPYDKETMPRLECWNNAILVGKPIPSIKWSMNPLFHNSTIPSFQYSREVLVVSPKSFSANYVVRVYRFEKENPKSLVGVVEEIGLKGRKAFTNYDELWEILLSTKRTTRKQRRTEVK